MSKTSRDDVVFQPARQARVSIMGTLGLGDIGVPGASHITITNMSVDSIGAFDGARDITWNNIDARNFYIVGVQDLLIKGGDFGPCTSGVDPCSNNKIDLAPPPNTNNRITIDGATFHDFRIVPGSDDHFECMIIFSGTNITIRNSRFINCEFFDIFLQHVADTQLGNITIEKNWFDVPWNGAGAKDRGSAVAFSPRGRGFSNVVIRNNSFAAGLSADDDADESPYSNFRVIRNIITAKGCDAGAEYQENVWAVATCGPADRLVPFGYTVEGGHLRPVKESAAVVRRIVSEAASGRSLRQIVSRLRRARLPSPSGGWNLARVRAVMADRAYLGGLFGARGSHPALVPRRTWQASAKRLK